MPPHWHVTATDAASRLSMADKPFAELLRHGSMSVELFAPQGVDNQQPHEQDELYHVISGHGFFVLEQERVTIAAGDVLFVRAGSEHRFEDFSDDLLVLVVFWGPKGGE
ncbi:cupin domain-containing protein [bacterium]|nr:cupin domain-containing protein [bacterium]